MGQEFFINSQELEDKIRQLLPSQGGAGAGFDLSASTQIIPVIDVTESAEGSNVRADLQTAFSHKNVIRTSLINTASTVTITNTTGYYRIYGTLTTEFDSTGLQKIEISDGATSKIVIGFVGYNAAGTDHDNAVFPVDVVVKLESGDSLVATSTSGGTLQVTTRQIADVDGNLTNP